MNSLQTNGGQTDGRQAIRKAHELSSQVSLKGDSVMYQKSHSEVGVVSRSLMVYITRLQDHETV